MRDGPYALLLSFAGLLGGVVVFIAVFTLAVAVGPHLANHYARPARSYVVTFS